MKRWKLLAICAMSFAILTNFCLSVANAEEIQDRKILEAEMVGAKKMATLVSLKDLSDQTIVAWLWEEPVIYSSKSKVEDMAPKKLLIPQNPFVQADILEEGQWLWKGANKALKSEVSSSMILIQREAWRFYAKGSLIEARESYEKSFQLSPNYWSALRLGKLWGSEDKKKTNFYYKQAYSLSSDKKSTELMRKSAGAAYLVEDYPWAMEMYSALLIQEPQNDSLYLLRGNVQFLQENLDGAISDYSKGISLNPEKSDFYLNRARVYSEKKNISSASTDYQKYLEAAPNDKEIWSEFIHFLDENKQTNTLRVVVDRWITVQPKEALAWNTKGAYDFEDKKYSAALVSFNKAIELDSKLASAWYNKALCFENIGFSKDWTSEKKWERVNEIKNCYEQFLKYSDSKNSKRERAQKRIKEMTPDNSTGGGKLLDI